MAAPRFPWRYWTSIVCFLSLLAFYNNVVLRHKHEERDKDLRIRDISAEGNGHSLWFHKNKAYETNSKKEYITASKNPVGKPKLKSNAKELMKAYSNFPVGTAPPEKLVLDPDLDVVVIAGRNLKTQRDQERPEKKHLDSKEALQRRDSHPQKTQSYPGFDPDMDFVVIKGRILRERIKQQHSKNQSSDQRPVQGVSRIQPGKLHLDNNDEHNYQQQQQQQQEQQQQQHEREQNQEALERRHPNRATSNHYDVVAPSLRQQLKDFGVEPVEDHEFKSQYVINPWIYEEVKRSKALPESPSVSTTKLISFYNRPRWLKGPKHTYNMDNKMCFYSCEVDLNGSNTSQADVLLIFSGYLSGSRPLPSPRPLGQIWVHVFRESPMHFGYPSNYDDWKSAFNWTWTYRTDSDIFSPYGFLSWRLKDLLLKDDDYVAIAKSKTRTATQFASHCGSQSGRDEYVKEMQDHIDVDVYGKCGTFQCPRSEDSVCEHKINDTYMFYLSFENSFCEDYVTEKFFRLFSKRLHVIPVVRGRANYTKFFPRGAFVNAADFSSAKELALYLKKLSQNTAMYAQMLKEKDKLVSSVHMIDWCDVCRKVHTDNRKKIISDIKAWSHYEGVCSKPPN